MAIEVEQKFRVDNLAAFGRRLASLQPSHGQATDQLDLYFAHPNRDFAQTDEAFRLRRVGELNNITYKGPKLDAATKTRREIEVPLASGQQAAADAIELFEALGFHRVAEVAKRRVHSTLPWQGWEIGVALDDVGELGQFVELEIVTDEVRLGAARAALIDLADKLKLSNCERRSYLELLLASGS